MLSYRSSEFEYESDRLAKLSGYLLQVLSEKERIVTVSPFCQNSPKPPNPPGLNLTNSRIQPPYQSSGSVDRPPRYGCFLPASSSSVTKNKTQNKTKTTNSNNSNSPTILPHRDSQRHNGSAIPHRKVTKPQTI